MSEYQYYHFQAIDQPLSRQQMQELRAISTRAEITPTSFINTYNWGDLKADPRELMRQYFDAHVYVTNWGTHRFMLKIPRDLMDVETAQLYGGDCFDLYPDSTHVILDFTSRDESGEDDDAFETEADWMAALLPLREEILRGDLRALYVAWLAGVWEEDESAEPPIPPGLSRLSGPLQRFAYFLRLDQHMLQAAMQGDTQPAPTEPTRAEMAAWVANVPNVEKDTLLIVLLTADDEARILVSHLRQRFQKAWRQAQPAHGRPAGEGRRTASALWHTSEMLSQEAQRRQAAEEARQRAEQERQAAAQRQQYLVSLIAQEPRLWQEVAALLSTTQPTKYDEAVKLLRDLRDLATDRAQVAQWEARLKELRQRYSRKSSLMQRLNKAGFP